MTNLAKHYQNTITYAYSEQTLMAPSNTHIAAAINNRVDFAYGLAKTPGVAPPQAFEPAAWSRIAA